MQILRAQRQLYLFDQDGRYTLARRAYGPHEGSLDRIGGFVDIGENFEGALYRELEEEVGLKA